MFFGKQLHGLGRCDLLDERALLLPKFPTICGTLPVCKYIGAILDFLLQPELWARNQGKGVARLWAKKKAQESLHMLRGVQGM